MPNTVRERDFMDNDAAADRAHEEIAQFAYQLWEQRGHPFGSPEVDWFRAEDEMRRWESPDVLPFSDLHMEPDEY